MPFAYFLSLENQEFIRIKDLMLVYLVLLLAFILKAAIIRVVIINLRSRAEAQNIRSIQVVLDHNERMGN